VTKEELERTLLDNRKYTDYQRDVIRILYVNRDGLTRQQISDKMFDDGHTHRLAGVLAALSKKLVPHAKINPGEAFTEYLNAEGEGDTQKLRLTDAFRAAIDALPNHVRGRIL
jgi:hypothetical protein